MGLFSKIGKIYHKIRQTLFLFIFYFSHFSRTLLWVYEISNFEITEKYPVAYGKCTASCKPFRKRRSENKMNTAIAKCLHWIFNQQTSVAVIDSLFCLFLFLYDCENISSFTLDLFVVTMVTATPIYGNNKKIKRKAWNVFAIIQKQNKQNAESRTFWKIIKASRMGYSVKAFLWCDSLLINTRFRFFYSRMSNF